MTIGKGENGARQRHYTCGSTGQEMLYADRSRIPTRVEQFNAETQAILGWVFEMGGATRSGVSASALTDRIVSNGWSHGQGDARTRANNCLRNNLRRPCRPEVGFLERLFAGIYRLTERGYAEVAAWRIRRGLAERGEDATTTGQV